MPQICARCSAEMPADFSFCGKCGARLAAEETVATSETRQVTVLFADISGFTALAERLDPEELHGTMRTAWDAIATDIRAAGGLIEKYIGDAVVAVFGAADEREDHPERAQRAALAILRALERTNSGIAERTGRRLALRVGVNTGIAVAGAIGDRESEFGVLGDAVNVAARLEQAAEPAEVLVGDATYRRTPGLFAYEPHPALSAKGKSAPLAAWRLLGEAVPSATAPARAPLVGRDDAMGALLGALDDALAGHGRIVSLVGEPGSGKTRLAEEVLADPRTRGARVARARCTPYDAHRAYGAVADLVRRVLAIPPTASVDHAHRTLGETLPEMEPETRTLVLAALGYGVVLPPLGGETRRRLLERGIAELLLRVASTQGMIASVADLQWCDPASLSVIAGLAPSLVSARVLLLTSYRPEFAPPWSTSRAHLQIRLTPLDDAASRALLDGALPPGALPEPIATEVAARAAGNPAYLEEAARWLLERGVVVERESGTPLADLSRVPELPISLAAVLLKRVESVGPTERRVLNAAAVAGRSFAAALLGAVFGPEVDVDKALAGLVSSRLLDVGARGGYRFRQTTARELVYAGMLARHRNELHGRIALAIESAFPEIAVQQPETLAYHFGASAHDARALEYAFRSGDRATSLHDLADALHQYRAAAAVAQRLPDGSDERARALLAGCDAAVALGDERWALALAEEALALAIRDAALRAALRRRAGRLAARAGAIERSAEHLADAERHTAAAGRERAELTLAKAYLARSDARPNEALQIARVAAKEAHAAGDRAAELRAEQAIVAFATDSGEAEEARRALERCAEHCVALGDLEGLARALATLVYDALDRGDLTAALRLAHELQSCEAKLGDVAGQAVALRAQGRAAFARARWSEAESALHRALALADPQSGGDGPEPADPAATLLALGALELDRGDQAQALTTLTQARTLADRSQAREHVATRIAAELARLALARGALEDARAHAAAALTAQRAHQCWRCDAGITPVLIETALASGDLEAAEAQRGQGLEHAVRLNLPLAIAEIRLATADLLAARGESAQAREECAAALATFERSGHIALAARARRRAADLERDAGLASAG